MNDECIFRSVDLLKMKNFFEGMTLLVPRVKGPATFKKLSICIICDDKKNPVDSWKADTEREVGIIA